MPSLFFEFDDMRSAEVALDTLNELGFRSRPLVGIAMEEGDLTSALEIAQANGGTLQELIEPHQPSIGIASMFDHAYGMDDLAVPAHLVNEDLPEVYMHPGAAALVNGGLPEGYIHASAEVGSEDLPEGYMHGDDADLGHHSGDEVNWMTPGIPR